VLNLPCPTLAGNLEFRRITPSFASIPLFFDFYSTKKKSDVSTFSEGSESGHAGGESPVQIFFM